MIWDPVTLFELTVYGSELRDVFAGYIRRLPIFAAGVVFFRARNKIAMHRLD